MKFNKRHLSFLLIVVLFSLILSTYKLPYYIYKPGGADGLNDIVEVENGYKSEGEMHLVTVSGGQATIPRYISSKFLSYNEILPIEQVRPKGITDEQHIQMQLHMMETSQLASTVVAYTAADEKITIEYNGVYVVSVTEDMPADGKLETGDRITTIDGIKISEADDLINYINTKQAGDEVELEIDREEKTLKETLILQEFDNIKDKIGIGIQLVTNRDVEVEPEVHFSSGKIGGPSAGLMFALEIYDQLTEEDLTKGYKVIGTGELDYDGNVLRIGSVDKKVVAAHRAGCDIFFAPNENGDPNSNYELAKRTAEEINTNMVIVPVDTFEEALTYLQNLDEKS